MNSTEIKNSLTENDELNQLSMNILIHAGNAREKLAASLRRLENQSFEEASKTIKEARREIVIAHGLQTSTLQQEAAGEQIRYSTLFCHAQDTLMTAKSEILIGEHLIKIIKNISK